MSRTTGRTRRRRAVARGSPAAAAAVAAAAASPAPTRSSGLRATGSSTQVHFFSFYFRSATRP